MTQGSYAGQSATAPPSVPPGACCSPSRATATRATRATAPAMRLSCWRKARHPMMGRWMVDGDILMVLVLLVGWIMMAFPVWIKRTMEIWCLNPGLTVRKYVEVGIWSSQTGRFGGDERSSVWLGGVYQPKTNKRSIHGSLVEIFYQPSSKKNVDTFLFDSLICYNDSWAKTRNNVAFNRYWHVL